LSLGIGANNSIDNVSVGTQALNQATPGTQSVALGYQSLFSNTAIGSIAIGYQSLFNNTTGSQNISIGTSSMFNNTVGRKNTAIGYQALAGASGTTSSNNVSNTSIGYQSLLRNNNGFDNTCVGTTSMINNSSGSNNTAIGSGALNNNTTASGNIGVGSISLSYVSTGGSNTALGYAAGIGATGTTDFCTFVGNSSSASGASIFTYTNSTALGANAVITGSNQIILGDTSISSLQCRVALTVTSDSRYKKNIQPLNQGVEFINDLNPVTFTWDDETNDDSVGFIAQDLKAMQEKHGIIPTLVNDTNPDKLMVTPAALIPIMVKAIQEVNKKVDNLTAIIESMQNTSTSPSL